VGDYYALKVNGKEFNKVLDDIKKKTTFTWSTAEKKHDPF
jgi:hypothetical protein